MHKFIQFIFGSLLTGAGWLVWKAAQTLVGTAVIDWIEGQIARKTGMTSPTAETVIRWATQIGPPLCFAALILLGYHFWYTRRTPEPVHIVEPIIDQPPFQFPSIKLPRISRLHLAIFGFLFAAISFGSVLFWVQSSRPKAATQTISNPPLTPSEPLIWHVVAGSSLDRKDVDAQVNEINSEDPSVRASVIKPTCTDYYAVATPNMSYSDAQKLLDQVSKLKSAQGAFLSDGECVKPSFPCDNAKKVAEKTICGDSHLAQLDSAATDAYNGSTKEFKFATDKQILNARNSCGDDRLCILDQQLDAIYSFSDAGIQFPWIGAYRLHLFRKSKRTAGSALPVLPSELSECTITKITRILPYASERPVGSESSGIAIYFADGGHQISSSDSTVIGAARRGDQVLLCLVFVPKNCPSIDGAERVYSATDFRTKDSWVLPDIEHICGEAD